MITHIMSSSGTKLKLLEMFMAWQYIRLLHISTHTNTIIRSPLSIEYQLTVTVSELLITVNYFIMGRLIS